MFSKTPPIDPISPSYHTRILSDEQLAQFKSGTFEVAREKTDWILKNHHPEPLSEDQRNELTRIVAAAEKELSQEA